MGLRDQGGSRHVGLRVQPVSVHVEVLVGVENPGDIVVPVFLQMKRIEGQLSADLEELVRED